MDSILQVAVLLAALGGPADSAAAPVHAPMRDVAPAVSVRGSVFDGHPVADVGSSRHPAAASPVSPRLTLYVQSPSDPWTSEDKFRHAAASWAAMVFTFAAVRSVHDEPDTALAIAVPVTAAFGIAKEIVDRRHGGPFSFRDLAADALGAGAAWLFLREVN